MLIFSKKKVYEILLIGFISCLFEVGYAQRKEIDSLLNQVKVFEKKSSFQKDTNYLNLINSLSRTYYTISSDSTLHWADRSLLFCQAINYEKGIVDALRNKGIVFRTDYNYPKALELYYKALRLAEKIRYTDGIGSIHNSIAIVYKNQNNFAEAIKHYEKALDINRITKDLKGVAVSLNNIAIIYFEKGEYEKALTTHLESLELRKKNNDSRGIANSLNNLGDVYLKLNKSEQAIEYYEQAMQINTKIGNKRGLASDLSSLANCYVLLNQSDKALGFARKSMAIASEIGYLDKVRDCYETISKIYQSANRYDSAFFNYQQFKFYSDSLLKNETEKQTIRLSFEYEFEKKELNLKAEQIKKDAINQAKLNQQQNINIILLGAVVGILSIAYYIFNSRKKVRLAYQSLSTASEEISQKNTEIVNQKEELMQSLKTVNEQKKVIEEQNLSKDKLFAIIGHDLNSPINSLKGLMNLVTDMDISPDEFRLISGKLKKGVEYVHFTLNNLLQWANSQMYGIQINPKIMRLYPIVKENCDLLGEVALSKQIKINNQIDEELTLWADPDQVSLVFRNLISNAIKFTNMSGTVTIFAKRQINLCQITIADTGIGMSQDILAKLFNPINQVNTLGTNNEKGTGLGLMLCKDFIEKNGGKIWAESQEGEGTQFHFTLPIKSLMIPELLQSEVL